jgi:hypothetical protein
LIKKGKSKKAKKGGSETDAPKQDAPKKREGKKKVQDILDKGKGKMSEASVLVPAKGQEKTPQLISKLMGDAIRIGGGDSSSNGQRVKTMAKRRPHTSEVERGNETVKRPKHTEIKSVVTGSCG